MRPTPFDLVFDPIAGDRFPAISDALSRAARDPRDRDAFLMQQPTVELIRELRPEGGIGDGMDQLVALVHHAYLFWSAGRSVRSLDRTGLDLLLEADLPESLADDTPAWYLQLPERRMWAQAIEESAHEPLDGVFVHHAPDGSLRVLATLGIHQDREGFTVVEAAGPHIARATRAGSAPFSSLIPGGAAAGLYSIDGADELLELGWRSQALEPQAAAAAVPPS